MRAKLLPSVKQQRANTAWAQMREWEHRHHVWEIDQRAYLHGFLTDPIGIVTCLGLVVIMSVGLLVLWETCFRGLS